MKQLFASLWGKGFAAGVLVCAAATLLPSFIQQAFAQQQGGGPGRLLHAPGTFMLSAAGGQSSGVYLIDTRTADTWYIVPGGTWSSVGNPVEAASKAIQAQKPR
jgi:hypothetical protein